MIRLEIIADKKKCSMKLDGGICTHIEAMNLAAGIGRALAIYVNRLPDDEQAGALDAFLKAIEKHFETR